MSDKKTYTMFLSGEISEIITNPGEQNYVRVFCKPEYLFMEGDSAADIHLGDKVFITVQYETKEIKPYTDHTILNTN